MAVPWDSGPCTWFNALSHGQLHVHSSGFRVGCDSSGNAGVPIRINFVVRPFTISGRCECIHMATNMHAHAHAHAHAHTHHTRACACAYACTCVHTHTSARDAHICTRICARIHYGVHTRANVQARHAQAHAGAGTNMQVLIYINARARPRSSHCKTSREQFHTHQGHCK